MGIYRYRLSLSYPSLFRSPLSLGNVVEEREHHTTEGGEI